MCMLLRKDSGHYLAIVVYVKCCSSDLIASHWKKKRTDAHGADTIVYPDADKPGE